MLARPTLKRPPPDETTAADDQARPTEGRFLLRVDGQVKRSFSSGEAALTAGRSIKKSYPVVAVSVVDKEDGATENITAYE